MHGIEKARLKNYIKTDCSPHYYGLALDQEQLKGVGDAEHQYEDPVTGKTMAKEQMTWIIHQGDLILLSSAESPDTTLGFVFREHDNRVFTIPIYQYLEDDGDYLLPTRVRGAAKGQFIFPQISIRLIK
jgi:hypothetical protein